METEDVRRFLPELSRCYEDLVPRVGEMLGETVRTVDGRHAINVNVLDGSGDRYEPHTDAQPYTAILWLNDWPPEDGGQLVYEVEGIESSISPRAGWACVFDGSTVPHYVSPLRADRPRVSVPMVYLPADAEGRPEGLDDHLYA
jgi:hypothetical protein